MRYIHSILCIEFHMCTLYNSPIHVHDSIVQNTEHVNLVGRLTAYSLVYFYWVHAWIYHIGK